MPAVRIAIIVLGFAAFGGCSATPSYVGPVYTPSAEDEGAPVRKRHKAPRPRTLASKQGAQDLSSASTAGGETLADVTGSVRGTAGGDEAARKAEAERSERIFNRLSAPIPAICIRC